MNRFISCLIISIILLLSCGCSSKSEKYSGSYSASISRVEQILFGRKQNNDSSDILKSALHICCEQINKQKQEQKQLDYLSGKGVDPVPKLDDIIISKYDLPKYVNSAWEKWPQNHITAMKNRADLLSSSVEKAANFSFGDRLFHNVKDKSENFSALLYYFHMLSESLSDDWLSGIYIKNSGHVKPYSGEAYCTLNRNKPSFSDEEKECVEYFSRYSSLDSHDRAGVAFANICADTMPPSNSRQNIGMLKPSGWSQEKYDGIVNSSPAYLFNRCHLIAHELDGNDTLVNLITGTRYMNMDGMKPFEDLVARKARETGYHILYRATPIYKKESNKVASGVQLEAYSVEDKGESVCFNVFCYNIQPGIHIEYMSGDSSIEDESQNCDGALPFATLNPSEENPDLFYEIEKYLAALFQSDSQVKNEYESIRQQIDNCAMEARRLMGSKYNEESKLKYKLYRILVDYMPPLLKQSDSFSGIYS